jgi:hypothetical protein
MRQNGGKLWANWRPGGSTPVPNIFSTMATTQLFWHLKEINGIYEKAKSNRL